MPPSALRVVLEATCTYWVTLATTVAQAGFAIAVINPTQAHAVAKALLKRSKIDAIDAQTLAQLAALLQPAPWTPPPAIYTELQQRLPNVMSWWMCALRSRINGTNSSSSPFVIPAVRQRMEQLIAMFIQQIAEMEQEIAKTFQIIRSEAVAAE